MRRMTGAIFTETRPDRMIRSAWRGEKGILSAPMLGRGTAGGDRREAARPGPPPREAPGRGADHRDHLDRAAGEAEAEREDRVRSRPVLRLLERRQEDAVLDVLLEVLALQLAAQHLARA